MSRWAPHVLLVLGVGFLVANIRIAIYMAIFAIVAIGGSMIAHWLRTGAW